PAAHNRLRSGPDGRPTYAAVVDTVERAMVRGLRPDISITLTARNLDGAAGAVRFALARDLPFSLNFYRECAPVPSAALSVEPDRLVDVVRGVLQVVRAYPAYAVPLAGILDRVRLDVPHRYPCSAGRDYVAVDARGGVAACQMLLDTPWSHLSAEDPLATVRCQGRDLFQPVDVHAECRDCTWRAACAGGCPLMRGTPLHEAYCRVYQALLPELVQLEARRLVTRHGIGAVV
ncbi:MAG: SPASM domain-containing protein, partial [Anaerolineae bacterium]